MGYEQFKIIYNVFKTIISVKTIMLLRLSGGLYYRISSNRIVCVITAVYCLAVCFFLTSAVIQLIVTATPAIVVKALSGLVAYCSSVIISLLTDSEYFGAYLSNIETIDILLGVRPNIDVPVTRLLFLAVVALHLSVALSFFWAMVEDGASISTQINFIELSYYVLSCSLINLNRIMIFELLWSRVRMFRQYLESNLLRVSRLQGSEDARNIVRQCMRIYKNILDTITKLGIPVKIMTIVSVSASVPKIVASVYELLLGPINTRFLRTFELLMDLTMACMPALLVMLARGEVQRMKVFISRKILTCEGPWGPSAHRVFKDIAKRIVDASRDQRAGIFLGKDQRGNAASVLGTFPIDNDVDEFFDAL